MSKDPPEVPPRHRYEHAVLMAETRNLRLCLAAPPETPMLSLHTP